MVCLVSLNLETHRYYGAVLMIAEVSAMAVWHASIGVIRTP